MDARLRKTLRAVDEALVDAGDAERYLRGATEGEEDKMDGVLVLLQAAQEKLRAARSVLQAAGESW